jgi:hypothetical protein
MYFHGRMKVKRKKLSLVSLLVLLCSNSFGIGFDSDFGQVVPGQQTDQFQNIKNKSDGHVLDSNDRPMEKYKSDGNSPLVPGQEDYGDTVSGKDSPTQFNANAPFSGLESDGYRVQTNEMILRRLVNKSEFLFAIDFYMNKFDYQDDRGIYDKTFGSNTGSKGGSLNLSSDYYLSKGMVNFGMGAGAGLGYSTGKGIFESNGQVSEMNFNLYSIPLDLRFSMEIPIGRAAKLTGAAGPSGMILIQNRSDRDNKEDGKTIRQFGVGYFVEGKLKFNLSYLMPDTGFEYYKFHEVSFMSVDLMVRTQDYSGFSDEISISGMSYGIGVTFEFL